MGDVRKGLRTVRNVVHNYNDAQVKVREATSNDPWGPAASLMSDVADMTYNHLAFSDIMQMLWKRMNDSGKDWRHVYKALVVLDYIIKAGTEKVAQHCKENLYFIQTLQNFQHMEENKDLGMNVREKAKQVVALLTDEEKLKNERVKAQKTRERFQYGAGGPGSVRDQYTEDGFPNSDSSTFSTSVNKSPSEIEGVRPQSLNEEEIQLQIALAMSKEEADEEERRRQRDDVRLQLALSESQTEYHKQKPVTVSSKDELFDVFHQPIVGNGSGGGGSVDPWGNDFVVETTGFDGGGHSGMNGMGERDPWSSPGNGNDGGRMMRPAVSPVSSHIPPAAATLDPWSQLTPMNASNPLSISPSNANSASSRKPNNPAETFLGQNSNLVNLDSLITPTRSVPPPTAAFNINPFGTAQTGSSNVNVPNPFHQAAAPAPTINQLRNVNTNPYDSFLPQPLQPLSTTPTPMSQQQSRYTPQQPTGYSSNNPFL